MMKYLMWLMALCLPLCSMDKREFKYFKQKKWYATHYIIRCRIENVTIGCIGCDKSSKDSYILHSLYVEPEYRHKGLGRELLLKAYWYLKEKGASKMYIQPGPFELQDEVIVPISDKQEYNDKMQKLIALFASIGFNQVGPLDYVGVSLLYSLLKIPIDSKKIMVKT